jgi:malonyl-CoA O-methyltransferase
MNAPLLDKYRIAESFSRAAESYDDAAGLQRKVGHQLLKRVPETTPQTMLDLGSGTGYFTELLRLRFVDAHLISLDLAQGMLNYARHHRPIERTTWICGDAEQLPLAADSLDLIFSNLAIQWCERPEQLFAEVNRTLRTRGRFVAATLGPESLHELRRAWAAVDSHTHVNHFLSRETLEAAMPPGLEIRAFEVENCTMRFSELRQLIYSLKGIGAHNMNPKQPNGLTSRVRIEKFREAYEIQRSTDGLLPMTYQVYYLEIEKS